MTYIPTGNEFVSLPKISEATAAIEDFTILHMGYKGLLDIRGDNNKGLITPFISCNGQPHPLKNLTWKRLSFWIPTFEGIAGNIRVNGTILAPIGERGFIVHLELTNTASTETNIDFGLSGIWSTSMHSVNEDKEIEGNKHCFYSLWNNNLIFDMRCAVPMFCFAPITDIPCQASYNLSGNSVHYSLTCTQKLKQNQTYQTDFYWGIGFEEVAAATSAKEMLRHGFDFELNKTLLWLDKRGLKFENQKLANLYNTNLFFCIFFSTGLTLDTEELVLMTSRSPRYYVSAAYWDRDSLLWSFPAILQADPLLARKMLEYVYNRQRRNFGIHSRFIDGTVLEPGFELDELVAPVLALERYIQATSDKSILHMPDIKTGIDEILEKLEQHRHPDIPLYDTFLQPTDDERVYPYLTYDNVLVWKALKAIAQLYPARHQLEKAATDVKNAIYQYCVKKNGNTSYFAWSIDLNGHSDVYDEPPGSLQLLPYFGFCDSNDRVYLNTVKMIRSPQYKYSFSACNIPEIGCPHAPHPWVLSIANSMLCGRIGHCLDILQKIEMDDLIACESVDETTGKCTSGEAFATCAGFLCYSIRYAYEHSPEQFPQKRS